MYIDTDSHVTHTHTVCVICVYTETSLICMVIKVCYLLKHLCILENT